MVSVMITSITMTIETMAATSKVGAPKWNGVEIAKPCASRHLREIDLAHQIAATTPPATQADEDRDAGEEPGQETVDEQDDAQGDGGEPDVGQRPEVRSADAAGRPSSSPPGAARCR